MAKTAEKACSEPKDSAMFSVRRLGRRVGSYATCGGTTGNWGAQSERILGISYDDWLRDKVVYGTPEAVVDRLHQLQEELGLDQLVYEINYGNQMSYELQVASLRLFNQRVIPQLN